MPKLRPGFITVFILAFGLEELQPKSQHYPAGFYSVQAQEITEERKNPNLSLTSNQNNLTIITSEPKDVCIGIKYINRFGDTAEGTKNCAEGATAESLGLRPEMFLAGFEVAGMSGKVQTCSGDGQQGCFLSGDFAAANTLDLSNKVLVGYTIAGIEGKAIVPVDGTVILGTKFGKKAEKSGTALEANYPNCSEASQQSCLATADYPSMSLVGLTGNGLSSANFQTAVSSTTTYEYWDRSGKRHQFSGDSDLVPTSIRNGVIIHGVVGTGAIHTDCSSDGEIGCLATASYISAFTTGAADKITAGQTLAGITGNVSLPSIADVKSGVGYGMNGTTFTGTLILPASGDVEQGVSYGAAGTEFTGNFLLPSISDVEQGVSYGAAGTEFTGNFVVPPITQVLTGVSYGSAGTEFNGSHATYSNCSSDGETGCVTTTAFASALTTGAADKILSGQTLAAVNGNVTLPAVTDVESALAYGVGGTALTGSFVIPAVTNVESGVSYGDSGTELTGTLVAPNAADVESGASYGAAATEFTGTFSVPAITDVESGVSYGAAATEFTGTFSVPTVSNVHTSVGFGASNTEYIGTALNPVNCTSDGSTGCIATTSFAAGETSGAASKIISGQTLAGVSGNVVLPAETDVKSGVTFGVAGTGSTGSFTVPTVGDVELGVSFGANGTEFTGTFVVPSTSNVLTGIGYGASGTEFTGTTSSDPNCSSDGQAACIANASFPAALVTGAASKLLFGESLAGVSGNVTLPAASVVQSGVNYGVNGSGTTGTLSVPAVADVEAGTTYGGGGSEFTGTFSLPAITDVESGVSYGASGTQFTGTFAVPANSDVLSGISFGSSGTEFNGSAVANTNCTSDGATGCITTATYSAALTTGAASKILSGQTLAGMSGNVTLPASSDVQTGTSYGVGGTGNTGTLAVPAASDVQGGVTYGASGTEFTGTFTVPAVTDVESGVSFGGSGTEFTGTFSVPVTSNVLSGTSFGGSGTEFTGSATAYTTCSADGATGCVTTSTYTAALATGAADKILTSQTLGGISGNITLPAASNVQSSVSYGVGGTGNTGTMTSPATGDVQTGVGYGASGTEFTGTFAAPAVTDVESGVTYGGGGNEFTGTFEDPATGNVIASVTYGASGSEYTGSLTANTSCSSDGSTGCVTTATYTSGLTTGAASKIISTATLAGVSGNVVLPAVGDVQTSVTYGASGTSNTGTLDVPAAADVQSGVSYGAAGTEFTGTFTVPAVVDVESGIGFGANGSEFTGTYMIPAIADVQSGVSYGAAGTEFSGAFTVPAVGDVQSGVNYGSGGTEFTGTFTVPGTGDVEVGVGFGSSGSEFTGTFVVPATGSVLTGNNYGHAGTEFSGSATIYSNCNSDGDTSCVTTATYIAALSTGAASKILSGQSLAGVSGNIVLPNSADVQTSVTYGVAGTGSTGTFAVPSAADVESGVSYGAGGSEFTGTLTLPATADVQTGVGYGASSTEFTGTFSAPSVGDVQSGVTYGGSGTEFTGTFGVPAQNVVLSGTSYGASGTEFSGSANNYSNCSSDGSTGCIATGSYTAALTTGASSKILTGQTLGGVSGNYTLPPASDVVIGFGFGASGTALTGTMASPSQADVQSGVGYGGGGTEFTGTFTAPAVTNVQSGVGYGAAGTEFTGTIQAPAVGDVESGMSYGSGGTEYSGTFSVPTISNVASGVSYGNSGTEFTGTANVVTLSDCTSDGQTDCISTATYAAALASGAANKILNGQIVAGASGTITLPATTSVLASTSYGVSGTGNTGTIADCSSNGADNCYLNPASSYDSASFTNMTAENIKRGVSIGGVTGTFPSSSSSLPRYTSSASGDTTTTGSDQTDLTTFITQVTTDGTFEFWDENGVYYTGTGDSDFANVNVKEGVSFENLNINGIVPATHVVTPAGLAANFTSSPDQMNVTWSDASVSGYLLIAREGAAVTWSPTNGTPYSTGTQGSDTIVYVGSAQAATHSGVTSGNTYHYALYSYNANYYYSPAADTLSETANDLLAVCAALGNGTWIGVPADSDYGTSDFCVMKYQAKNVSSSPESNAAGSPWANINQTNAQSECQSLGSGYDLISNDQWMTIGSNVANVGTNWSSGTVGTGTLFRGHTDNSPSSSCAASTDDSYAYVESNCTPKQSGGGENDEGTQRRTLNLDNGEVIWDLAGNIWEWTTYYNPNGKPTPTGYSWREFTALSSGTNVLLRDIFPTNAVKSFWNDSWNSSQSVGKFYPGDQGSEGAMIRGGEDNNGSDVGVFAMGLHVSPSDSGSWGGFRCVYVP